MQRFLLGLIYLSYLTSLCKKSEGRNVENKTMQLGDRLVLTSPSFPQCCLDDFTYHIYLRCPSACAFDVMFIDVDLPETSTLSVYSGIPVEGAYVAQATYSEDGWTRPSRIIDKPLPNYITITSTILNHKFYPQYSGVKVQVIAIRGGSSARPAAVTSASACKSVQSLQRWKGGEVAVTPLQSQSENKPKVDCLWVLRKPAGATETLQTFVRFTYTKDLHGILAVRNGSNSEATALFYVDTDHKDQNEGSINHGKEGFTSPGSLFVRLRKASDQGYLTFVYGLFYRINAFTDDEGHCYMNGEATGGFFCKDSEWCIPSADRCDGVQQCPEGEDEKECPVTTTPATVTTTSLKPTTGKCGQNEKICEDGTCIPFYQQCPVKCGRFQKKCDDGRCIPKNKRCQCEYWQKECDRGKCVHSSSQCPEDCQRSERFCPEETCVELARLCDDEVCPSITPHQCGNQCYPSENRCDGHAFCDNYGDELDCDTDQGGGTSFPWFVILAVVGGVVLLVAIICAKRKRTALHTADLGRPVPVAGAEVTSPANGTEPGRAQGTMLQSASLTDNVAPPPCYDEALRPTYDPPVVPTEPLPPSYESVAATGLLPSNDTRV